MNIQTLEKKRKVELNLKEESECNQKKPKFALDNGDDWYPVWIILKDWALKKYEKIEKEIERNKKHYDVSRVDWYHKDYDFWTCCDIHMNNTYWTLEGGLKDLEYFLDIMHYVDHQLRPPSRHVCVQNEFNKVSKLSANTKLVWNILKDYTWTKACEIDKYLVENEVYVKKLYKDQVKNSTEVHSNNEVVRKKAIKEKNMKVQILQDEFYCHLDKYIDLLETEHLLEKMHDVETKEDKDE